jgi:hypothetical protein
MAHPVWSEQELLVEKTHVVPSNWTDRTALRAVALCRWAFDTFTFFKWGPLTEKKVLNRAIFLETVAAVPGMVIPYTSIISLHSELIRFGLPQTAGMLRHLRSLRRMDRDHGWIHTLLEEAENERMHLLTFLKLRNPGWVFRASVVITQATMSTSSSVARSCAHFFPLRRSLRFTICLLVAAPVLSCDSYRHIQGIFMNLFFFTYLVHPKICHRYASHFSFRPSFAQADSSPTSFGVAQVRRIS